MAAMTDPTSATDEHPDGPIIVDHLATLALEQTDLSIYERPIGVRPLHRDLASGAEHYLIRYPAGLVARPHRHTAAHTIVVLAGHLVVNGRTIGPGSYCHFPAGVAMHHAPTGDGPCLFVIVFDGPFDVEPLDGGGPTP
jgi:quercetin dioxygenase-like cupin family protein